MKPFHEELKEIRLEKNISLEHIHDVTKIRVVLLEKIEEGDTSIAPAPIIRAFLREYAQVVGIDPERVIKRYENKVDTIREPERHNTSPITEPKSETVSEDSAQPVTETPVPKPKAEPQPQPEPVVTEPEPAEEVSAEEKTVEADTVEATETETPVPEVKTTHEAIPEETTVEPEEPAKADSADTSEVSEAPESVEEQPPAATEATEAETTSEKTGLEAPHRVPTRQSRLEIEEPGGANKLAVAIFVIIIIIAAAVMFWINN